MRRRFKRQELRSANGTAARCQPESDILPVVWQRQTVVGFFVGPVRHPFDTGDVPPDRQPLHLRVGCTRFMRRLTLKTSCERGDIPPLIQAAKAEADS